MPEDDSEERTPEFTPYILDETASAEDPDPDITESLSTLL